MSAIPLWLVGLVTGVSGFCSLLYQVMWDRTVRYNFGGDSISSAIVSATFILGLGLGAWLFGRSRHDAFRAYAVVEVAIGLFGLASFHVIAPLAEYLAVALGTGPEQLEGLRPVVVVGCVLLLLPPCTLIGGTLPLMFRCFVEPMGADSRRIGLVYGLNTLGAGLGILAAPLLVLNWMSLPAALTVAGCLNVALGGAILALRPRHGAPSPAPSPAARHAGARSAGPAPLQRTVAVVAFVSGAVALGFEVSLFRAFQVVNPSSAYNFPAVLAPFLLALAAGSVLFTRNVADAPAALVARAGTLLAATALALLLSVWASSLLREAGYPVSLRPLLDGYGGARTLALASLFAAILVVPVPLLTGAIFPLALRAATGDGARLPAVTGRLYLVNSTGGFAGAMLGKFVGFGTLGTRGFLSLLCVAACATGLHAVLSARRHASGAAPATAAPAAVAATLAAVAGLLLVPAWAWQVYVTGGADRQRAVREGVTGVAEIRWQADGGDVLVNGQYMSRLPDHPRHVKQAVFLLAQPARAHVLLLGLGGGGIVRDLAADPQVERIDVVDWSWELPALLAEGRAGELLDHALASPKVRVLRTDARMAVTLLEPGSYDLVFDNLAFANWVGATNIKSESYFRRVRALLRPGGVFVKGANYSGSNRLAVLASLAATFPVVQEHAAGEVVVASVRPPRYDDGHVARLVAARAGAIGAPPDGAAWFRDGFAAITPADLRGAAPVRDELLVHEYYWRPM